MNAFDIQNGSFPLFLHSQHVVTAPMLLWFNKKSWAKAGDPGVSAWSMCPAEE